MTSSLASKEESLTGSCPCSSVSWSSTIPSSGLCFCHCKDCVSSSPINSPILYGFFLNDAIKYSSNDSSSETDNPDSSNITYKEESRAIRGSCKHCGSLIYMKYHSSPDEIDLNMALCRDSAVLERSQHPVVHIFCEDEVPEGHQACIGFSDEQKRRLNDWENGGRKKRSDV